MKKNNCIFGQTKGRLKAVQILTLKHIIMKKRVLTFLNEPGRKLDFYDVLTLFGFTLVLFIGVLFLFTLNNLLNLI